MAKPVYLGKKIRRLRERRKLTQASVAADLGISPSYLNLIEHNKRSLTAALLLKVARRFDVDLQGFQGDDQIQLTRELEEAFSDDVFDGHDVGAGELADLAAQSPGLAGALLGLYRAFRAVREDARGMASKLADPAALSALETRLPSEEVSDMIHRHDNYFDELERAAEGLWDRAELRGGDVARGLIRHLEREHGVRVRIEPSGAARSALRSFAADTGVLRLSEMLSPASLTFQLAHQVGLLELADIMDRLLDAAPLGTPTSVAFGRIALGNYFAAAVAMPYAPFLAAARSTRYDIEVLQRRFRASLEQVCHRLCTLRRPRESGVPLHFVRVDIAGNISKRFSGSGIGFARHSGACPRWNVHTAFLAPGQICKQVSRMPDGTTYFCIARTVRKGGGGHLAPQTHFAIGLGCEVAHAKALVYADGVDLEHPEAAVPIGVSCRICERMDCRQRAFPPLNERLDVDPNRRGLSFYYAPDA